VTPTQIVITNDGQSLTFAVVASTNFLTKTGAGTIASVTAGSRVRIVSLSASPTTAGAVYVVASESSHGHGVNGTVTSVTPTQIVITNDGQSLTFALSASTTYAMMNGASATFANVTVGSRVRVVASTTSLTTAGEVFVFANAPAPQSVEGVVTSVTPTQIVISHDGQSLTYAVVASTSFAMRGAAASITNVTVGSHVRIVASTTSSSTAGLVIISASESAATSVKGIVTAITPTSITLATRSGLVSFTINASTVFMKDHQALVPTDVTVGAEVRVVATAATTTPLTAGMVKLLGH
jgi:RNase P/RNase MRP subunit p29